MSIIVDLCKAVAAELNDNQFSVAFTAERKLRPRFRVDAGELKDLKVVVAPGISEGPPLVARKVSQEEHTVQVAFLQKPETADLEHFDALTTLVEEVKDFMGYRRLAAYPAAVCIRWTLLDGAMYLLEHLDQFGSFTGVLALTYRVERKLA